MLQRIIALTIKELLAVLRDKRSRMAIIFPPLFQLIVFSMAATLEVKNANLGVFNLDAGRWGTELIQRFTATHTFSNVTYLRSQDDVKKALDEQRVLCVLSIPDDFSAKIDKGTGDAGQAQFLVDGRKTNSASIVSGYAVNIMNSFNTDIMRDGKTGKPLQRLPVMLGAQIREQHWYNPNLDFLWFTLPGLFCMLTMIVTLIVTSASVAREREMGTFEQLLVSPLRIGEILAGKALSAMLIATGEATLCLIAARLVFHVPFEGNVLMLYMGLFGFIPSIVGIGLFVSSLSMTQQQALLGTFVFMVPAMMLSGFATPIENMPLWLQPITHINPLTYFLVISRGVFLRGMLAGEIWQEMWPMLIISCITLSAASWLFRHRME